MTFSLNYIWIEAARLKPPKYGTNITCNIPQPFIDNVLSTAQHYPTAVVNIWIDVYGVGNHPMDIMRGFNDSINGPNISFKSLDDIPKYNKNPLFKLKHTNFADPLGPIWQQADIARLIVLEECLRNRGQDIALYSDFDLNLTSRDEDYFLGLVQKHGVIVGYDKTACVVENQFMGFSRKQLPYLTDVILRETIASVEDGYNGWMGFTKAFEKHARRPYGITSDDIFIPISAIKNAKAVKSSYQNPNMLQKIKSEFGF